jgi:hypothetical protein
LEEFFFQPHKTLRQFETLADLKFHFLLKNLIFHVCQEQTRELTGSVPNAHFVGALDCRVFRTQDLLAFSFPRTAWSSASFISGT